MTIVIIQRLVTRWTKESRGEPGATRRNATPVALPVPGVPPKAEGILLHSVSFFEREGFEADPVSTLVPFEEYPRDLPELMLRRSADDLGVRCLWTYALGAPERPHGGITQLAAGEWLRVMHNGRVAHDRGWSYQRTIVNIANGSVERGAFIETEPVAIDDHRAELR